MKIRKNPQPESLEADVHLDAILAGAEPPTCEWKPEQCRRAIAFNITCKECSTSEDYCTAHTRKLMTAHNVTCGKCGRSGTPREVVAVREIRGL